MAEPGGVSVDDVGPPPGRRVAWGTDEIARGDRESGTAFVGTLVGFAIFMVLLLVAVQTLVHLYATSTVTAAALDAAQQVATHPDDQAAEIPLAEALGRQRLGHMGAGATFHWVEADGQKVVLEVTVNSPGFLPLSSGMLRIDRTVVMRTERFR